MAAGVCIGSHGPVKSVRLFSKVPPTEIQSLALDQSSMTSNRLAQIILSERYGSFSTTHQHAPDLAAMLRDHDACVLIGDIGMTSPADGLYVLDLGEEWRALTGKPFVWAAWIGDEALTPELSGWLLKASRHYCVGRELSGAARCAPEDTAARQKRVLEIGAAKPGWTEDMLRDYFLNVMVYEMDEFVLSGLREFQRLLLAHGFDDCVHFPTIV
jgi:chorismate dehydratase